MMATEALNTYLNTYLDDHLAGSTAAIDSIDRLVEMDDPPAGREFLKWLRGEFAEDRAVIEDVIRRVGGDASTLRQLVPTFSALTDVDFARIELRAEAQHARVEVRRLDIARVALADPPAA